MHRVLGHVGLNDSLNAFRSLRNSGHERHIRVGRSCFGQFSSPEQHKSTIGCSDHSWSDRSHEVSDVRLVQLLIRLIIFRNTLSANFDVVQNIDLINSNDTEILEAMKRPELGVTLSKIHCWRLTQYKKCVFLDADTLILQNIDELFEKEELSAVPDIGWPDCFNSGVFVYQPCEDTFRALLKLAKESGSFDGGDQGLLNTYFSDWRTKDVSRILSFIYNMSSVAVYSYLPAYRQ